MAGLHAGASVRAGTRTGEAERSHPKFDTSQAAAVHARSLPGFEPDQRRTVVPRRAHKQRPKRIGLRRSRAVPYPGTGSVTCVLPRASFIENSDTLFWD